MKEFRNSKCRALTTAAVLTLAAMIGCATTGTGTQQRFSTPREAAVAMFDALERDDRDALVQILGTAYRNRIVTADWDAEREGRQKIWQAADDMYTLRDLSETEVELVVGVEQWPFPILIISDGSSWYFDTERGLDELVNRRIGGNELTAIELSLAYVDAQIAYALEDRNGDGLHEYAQRLSSTPGARDGLYWKASGDEPLSPLGPLVVKAERYLETVERGDPIRGYYFRVLTRQGDDVPGGSYDYVVNGRMVSGFGLVAFPADYDITGVMTFVVSQRGVVYQKNLGADGGSVVEYNPDDSWRVAAE